MERIKHRDLGEGVIINRTENRITVRFDKDGSERRYSIPQSFNLGLFEMNENLKKEVDEINEAKKEELAATVAKIQSNNISSPQSKSKKHSSKKPANTTITCAIEQDFETYLINSGYKEETDAGAPSTVSSYIKAIHSILENEQITWQTLVSQISDVISIYDTNGAKEHLGNKSNKTWINALRRFEEFVNHSGV